MRDTQICNFLDTTHGVVDKRVYPAVDFPTICTCVTDSGIKLSTSSMLKCVDLYIRVLTLCRDARTEDDIKDTLSICICDGGYIRTGVEYLTKREYYANKKVRFGIKEAFKILLDDIANERDNKKCMKIPESEIEVIKTNIDYILSLVDCFVESLMESFKKWSHSKSIRLIHPIAAIDHTNNTINCIDFDYYYHDNGEMDLLYIESNFIININGVRYERN